MQSMQIPIQNAPSPYIRIGQPLQQIPQQVMSVPIRPMILNQQHPNFPRPMQGQMIPQGLIQYPSTTPIQMPMISPQQIPQQHLQQPNQIPIMPQQNASINQKAAKRIDIFNVPDVIDDNMPIKQLRGIEGIMKQMDIVNQAYIELKKKHDAYKSFYNLYHQRLKNIQVHEEIVKKFEEIRALYLNILENMNKITDVNKIYSMLQEFKMKEREIYQSMNSLYTTERV